MKKSVWQKIFAASTEEDLKSSPLHVQNGGTASITPGTGDALQNNMEDMLNSEDAVKCSPDGNLLVRRLPLSRLEKYTHLRIMAKDPTIDSAIKMHIAQALAAKPETGEIITIDSVDGKDDNKIVKDLKDTFSTLLNQNLEKWAYAACLFGWQPLRVYGEDGKGVTQVRCDYYTLPDYTSRYERVGNLAGYASTWQQIAGSDKNKGILTLMPPWSFVEIKLPNWQINHLHREPIRQSGDIFSIDNDDWEGESYTESQDYGTSLIETAYEPWVDLQEAILSLNMSRKNAANVERLIGVQTGKLNPQKAAQYLGTISNQMQKAAHAQAQKSLRKGYVQTVWNHIIPIFSTGQGQLDISTVEGKPDIASIEDIKFHINRLGSAVGIDPSLLGFGEVMSGGLGDGGFFRMSVMAAIKANMIRTAVEQMIHRLFEIHVAYKHDKVFLETERPWQIKFHSLNSAIAREQAEQVDRQAGFAMSVTQILQMIDPNLGNVEREEYQNWILTDLLHVDEEKAKAISAKITPGNPDDDDDDFSDLLGESKTDSHKIKQMIYEALSELETNP